jgi:hypothetical protein
LTLDGTANGVVTVADNAALQITSKLTIMCWAKSFSGPDLGYIFGRTNAASAGGWSLQKTTSTNTTNASTILSGLSGGGLGGNSTRMTFGESAQWQHYAASYDASLPSGSRQARVYQNGILDFSSDGQIMTIPNVAGLDFLIGNRTGGVVADTFFYGAVYDIRVYSRILTQDEICRVCCGQDVSPTELVLHMPCTDGSGTTVANIANSGVGNGVMGAGAAWQLKGVLSTYGPGDNMPFRTREMAVA